MAGDHAQLQLIACGGADGGGKLLGGLWVVGKRAAGDNHGGRGVGLDQLRGDGAQLAGALVQNGADGGVGVGYVGGVGKRGGLHALVTHLL